MIGAHFSGFTRNFMDLQRNDCIFDQHISQPYRVDWARAGPQDTYPPL
jgi:hypothetical protein